MLSHVNLLPITYSSGEVFIIDVYINLYRLWTGSTVDYDFIDYVKIFHLKLLICIESDPSEDLP